MKENTIKMRRWKGMEGEYWKKRSSIDAAQKSGVRAGTKSSLCKHVEQCHDFRFTSLAVRSTWTLHPRHIHTFTTIVYSVWIPPSPHTMHMSHHHLDPRPLAHPPHLLPHTFRNTLCNRNTAMRPRRAAHRHGRLLLFSTNNNEPHQLAHRMLHLPPRPSIPQHSILHDFSNPRIHLLDLS